MGLKGVSRGLHVGFRGLKWVSRGEIYDIARYGYMYIFEANRILGGFRRFQGVASGFYLVNSASADGGPRSRTPIDTSRILWGVG